MSMDLRRARVVALALLVMAWASASMAADHEEAPGTRADDAADIADFYAWHDADRNLLVTAITFDGLRAPERRQRGNFDDGVVYTVNIDTNCDLTADINVDVRFVRNARGKWRMLVENMPGAPQSFVAPVDRRVRVGQNTKVFAGLRDDPFFFDLEGFTTTLQTGTLSFDGDRDSVAGLNATAIVLQMRLDAVVTPGETIKLWATSARN